jgi:hypothetical protein
VTREPDQHDQEGFGQNRRDFLRALSGAVGVAIVADATTVGDIAEAAGRRRSHLPSGYVWQRVLGEGQGGLIPGEAILPGVMINDRSELIFQTNTPIPSASGSGTDGIRSVYRMRIGRGRKPGARRPQRIVRSGDTLSNGVVVKRIGAGDTNNSGAYVTTIEGEKFFSGVYIQRPGFGIRPLISVNDRIPGPQGRYSGHFGDIDIDSKNNIFVVASYTLPGDSQHGLFSLPNGRRRGGRLLLRTGHRIPNSRAVITRLGLVERHGPYFVQQVFGRQRGHRARRDLKTEPSGFIAGRVSRGRKGARLLVGAKLLKPAGGVVEGEAYVGPRVDRHGTAATVTHKRPGHLTLHRHQDGRSDRIAHTGNRTRRGPAETISAPTFGPGGLLYYRAISKKTMELYVVHGNDRRMILETGDKVGGKRVQAINLGWHTDQIDSRGRLAFQVEYSDGSTGIVVGTPV